MCRCKRWPSSSVSPRTPPTGPSRPCVSAQLIEHDQARAAAGLFDTSRYRLVVAGDALARVPLDQPATAGPSRRARSAAGRRAAVASDAGGFVEQLVLLPEG